MDFRGWKKVCDDGKTCTLEHPKGHKLTVALKGLSGIHREQIKRLKMADGGPVDSSASASDQPTDPSQAPHTPITINVGTPATAAPAPQPQAPAPQQPPPANPATQFAQQPVKVDTPQPAQGLPNLNSNGQTNPSTVMKNAVETIPEAQKNIDVAQAKAEGQNLDQYTQALGQNQQQLQDRYNNLAGHVNDFDQYMQKNPIDPKHYQESMGAGAKTATALGLFFGGLSVPFGGHNFAIDFLNKQIDRDIEGQKSRADQHKTIYGAYRDLYGEGKEAYNATKATLLDIYNNKQKMISAQLGTPIAQQKSNILSNQMAVEKEKSLREGATQLGALPGFNPKAGAPAQQGPQAAPKGKPSAPPVKGGDWEGSAGSGEKKGVYKILSPNSQGRFNSIMNGYDPQWSPKSDQVAQQFTAAQQAEKVLNGPKNDGVGGIHDLFQQMHLNIGGEGKVAGFGTHARRAVQEAESIPYAGPIVKAIETAYPKGDSFKEFETAKNQLQGDLATALNGLMTPTDIQTMVEKNLPAYLDSKEDVAFKEKAMVNMIKKAVRSSYLQGSGLLKKDD